MKASAFIQRHRVAKALSFGLAIGLLWASVPSVPAQAAVTTLYLGSDGVPLSNLSPDTPTAADLPNYDPGRDDQPGLTLKPTLLAGLFELDPAKYQKWTAPKGGVDIDGPVTFKFWSASDGFQADRRGTVRVGLHDCNQPETRCRLIAYKIHSSSSWSGAGWTKHTVRWNNVQHEVPNGHHLMLKVVAGITSQTPLLFAYDTAAYPSRLEITGGASNAAPIAVDDSGTTEEDTQVIIDILGNDEDTDGDTISVTAVGNASHGTVADNGDGTVTYAPSADWNGTDGFSYTISDGADSDDGDVSVRVTAINDRPIANDESGFTSEDTPVVVDVLDNDTDVDGDTLALVALIQPPHGAAVDNGDGTVTYTPSADWSGTASIGYSVSDGAETDEAWLIVDVAPVNDAPTAIGDAATVPEDGAVTLDLLSNDTDVDGDPLSVAAIGIPAHGKVTDHGDGTITYSPNADWNGTEIFSYNATDGALTDPATVTVTVLAMNDLPIATDITLTMGEDTVVTIDPVARSSDVDGDTLTVVAVTPAINADVLLNPAGDVTITPDPDWNGLTSFDYTVSDGSEVASATVTVVVAAVNDAPVLNDDTGNTEEDVEIDIDVLANDTDVDGDTLTLAAITSSGKGTAVIVGPSVRFTPKANWSGTDTITYTVTDGLITLASSAVITVTPVNDDPIAVDDHVTTNEDQSLRISALANDIDKDNGDRLRFVSVGPASNGTSSIDGGKLKYVPNPDYHGIDTFDYTIRDGSWETSTATVTVTVRSVNDIPVVLDDTATTNEDAAVRIDVLANDSDIDGDHLSVSIDTAPDAGSASVASDGTVTFTPLANWNGTARFTYLASDGSASAGGNVEVTVRAVNDAPSAAHDTLELDEDTSASLDPTSNDTDVDGDSLHVSAWDQPGHGTVKQSGDRLIYTPDANFFGFDRFSYTATDGMGAYSAAVVDVVVHAIDDVPLVRDDIVSTPAGEPVTIVVTGNDTDPDGDALSIVAFTQGRYGTVTVNEDGTLTFTPNAEFVGTDEFMYVASDGTTPQTATVTLSREVDGAALVEISLTPSAPAETEWVTAQRTSDVVADEARDTAELLAAPALLAAAAAGVTVLAQSQMASNAAVRLGQRINRKP